MKFSLDRKGSVTTYFAIVLVGIIGLNFIMYDFLRIKALKTLKEGTGNLGVYSCLANFDKNLEESYGIYGLSSEKEEENYLNIYDVLSGGATDGIMVTDIVNLEVKYSMDLSDTKVLKEEIRELMKYKSGANGLAVITEKLKLLISNGKTAGGSYEQDKIAKVCDEFESKIEELERKTKEVNTFFDGIYSKDNGSFIKAIEDLTLPESVIYEENSANLLKNAVKIYKSGVDLYLPICFELVSICDSISDLQKEATDLLSTTANKLKNGEIAQSESLSKAIVKLRTEVLGYDNSAIKAAANRNYSRCSRAENLYKKFEISLNAGEKLDISKLKSAVNMISNCYSEFEKISFDYKKDQAAYSTLSYAVTDGSTGASKFFALCKNEIPKDIYNNLPSNTGTNPIFADISNYIICSNDFVKALESLEDYYFTWDYVNTYFYDASQYKSSHERYLTAEIEYIINGNRKDKDNITASYYEILALREMLNIAHIMRDKEKSAIVDEVAEGLSLLSEGYGREVYKTIIIGAWATTESVYDMKRLENGESVPLVKGRDDWKMSIDGIIQETYEDNEDTTANCTDMKYGDYLKLLLCLVPEEVKLRRIQDLLELNMYKTTNKYVKISEFYTKVGINAKYQIKTFIILDDKRKNRYSWEVAYEASFLE